MKIDLTIPLWGIIVFCVPFLMAFIWLIIRLYFQSMEHKTYRKENDKRFTSFSDENDKELESLHGRINKIRDETEQKFTGISNTLIGQGQLLSRIDGKVDLLIQGKIK